MTTQNLRGAHILLTGASKGLGASLAHELAGRGAKLTLVARPSAELDKVATATGGEPLPLDLSDLAGLTGAVARAEERNGPLDILINNAALVTLGRFDEFTAEDVQRQVFTNLLAPMELARQTIPGMRDRRRGLVVNVASLSANISVPNVSCYSVSKTGLAKFTMDLQAELEGSGVGASLVSLGAVGGTPMIQQFEDDARTSGFVKRFKTFTTPADEVARKIADAIENGRAIVVIPRVAAALVHFNLIPTRLASRVIASR